MNWLSNLKIVFKIGVIVALMGLVTIGTIVFATQRMQAMEDANSDLMTRVGKASTMASRSARRAEIYVSTAFQLVTETTEAGKARLLAQAADSRKYYENAMAQVLKNLPEKSAVIEPIVAGFAKTFATCDPAIRFASTTTTPEDNLKAAARVRTDCATPAEAAMRAQGTVVDGLLSDADKASEQLTLEANSAIRWIYAVSGAGLLISLVIALWIGNQGSVPADRAVEGCDGGLCPQ